MGHLWSEAESAPLPLELLLVAVPQPEPAPRISNGTLRHPQHPDGSLCRLDVSISAVIPDLKKLLKLASRGIISARNAATAKYGAQCPLMGNSGHR
jgi:hypothetical protein